MSTPKVVQFSAFGRTVPAIVLAAREGEVSHLGSDDEPILTLALIDPARETGLTKDKDGNFVYPVGRLPQVFIEHDVVHETHEFSEEFWKARKRDPETVSDAEVASLRGHGEYAEYIPEEAKEFVGELRERIAQLLKDATQNSEEAARQRARADKAEADLAAAKKELEAAQAPKQ
jgi:hypothetical protein